MSLNSIEYFSQTCRLVLFHLKSYITVNSCQRFLDFSDDLIFLIPSIFPPSARAPNLFKKKLL